MNHLVNLRLCFLFVLLFVLSGFSSQLPAAEKADVTKKEAPVKEEPKATLIDLFSWSGILPKELIDLKVKLDALQDIDSIDKQLPKLTEEVANLQWEVSLLKAATDLQVLQVDTSELDLAKLRYQLTKFNEPVTRAITDLSRMHKDWITKKQTLAEFRKQVDQSLSYVIEERKDLSDNINTALQLIEKQLNPALTLGKKIAALQVELYAIDSNLRTLKAEIRKNSTQQTSPSMLSKEFYTRINMGLVQDSYVRVSSFVVMQIANLKGNYNLALLIFLAIVLLYWGIKWTRHIAPEPSKWHPFATNPLATTTFLVSAYAVLFIIILTDFDVPKEWEKLLHILTVVSVISLVEHLLEDEWRRKFLTRLSCFLVFTMLLFLIGLPQTLIFIYVFYVSIVASIVYFYQLRIKKTAPESKTYTWIHKIWGVFPILTVLSGITGYDQFAIYFFSVCLSTVVAVLIIWMFYQLNTGLLELTFSVLPIAIVRKSQSVIMKSLRPVIILIHLLFLFSVLGVLWTIWPTASEALASIFNIGFKLGDIHISPGFIMTICLVFYTALLLSRAAQALLLKEVLPRYDADTGVQMSIARLMHYAILTIGFFVMLRVLGFKIEQITLLGGALGVGIGFGLQAIVNNFASGLILLFERPIKVGDTIQLGSEFGEVKELGLRATIIQTFDNAEIVVPNSDLVTGQVVNWTLANRKVRVRVPVGVAYGTDVAKVLEILKGCAEANPMVLSTPKPVAFFLAFGASSLDFELRAWIPDFLEKTQALSDLNQDIEAEFAINNIEIPFPQSDLHLRSVDEKTLAGLRDRLDQAVAVSDDDPEIPGNIPEQT